MPAAVGSTSSPAPMQASAARMPGPPALVRIATRRPRGSGCSIQAGRDVEHLVDRVGANDARLMKQAVDRRVRLRRGRLYGWRPRADRPAFVPTSRRRSASIATRGARAARTGADCRTIRDRAARPMSPDPARRTAARSLPEMSALLPRLTKVERPSCRGRGQLQHREAEAAALRGQRNAAAAVAAARQTTRSAGRRIGVDDTHAVRAHHAHAVTAHALDELGLQFAAARIGLGEAGRDDDEALDAGRGAVVDDGEHGFAGHRDDRQIDAESEGRARVGVTARARAARSTRGIDGYTCP